MKLEVLQENLSKALVSASRLVSSRAPLPILGNILLATESGRLKISATSLETTITIFVGAKILKEGSFTLPARTFTELVGTLPAGKIILELTAGQMSVSTGKFSAKINGIPATEWPTPTEAPPLGGTKGSLLSIPSSDFLSLVAKTAFSAATDDGRPVLTGVLFLPTNNVLVLAATDGFRLSKVTLPKISDDKSLIVPAKALTEAARIVGEETGREDNQSVSLSFQKNQITFAIGEVILSSRLLEGTFPAFEKIIPATKKLSVSVSSSDLLRAIRAASIFARDNANIIKFSISNLGFRISSVAAQVGENESEIDAKIDGDTKEEFLIAFNYRYLLDFLSVTGDAELIMEFSSPLSPGVFKIEGQKDFLHLIMPVRVQS